MSFDPMRHLLASIAFRFRSAVIGAPDDFGGFEAGEGVKKPEELATHCVQVLRYARSSFDGSVDPRVVPEGSWDDTCAVFFDELTLLDAHFAAQDPPGRLSQEQLLHGPLSDVLTHIGQLNMLRRLHGSPVVPQSFPKAPVETGRVGADQPPPVPRK